MARTSGKEIYINVRSLPKELCYEIYGKDKVDMAIAILEDDREAMIQIITRVEKVPIGLDAILTLTLTPKYFPVFRMLKFPQLRKALFDKNVVTAAVMHDPANLRWVVDPNTCDVEVVKEALRRQGDCIIYAPLWKAVVPDNEWKGLYREFVLCSVQSKCARALNLAHRGTLRGMELQKDREVVMEAVKSNGISALRWASKELQKDREIILAAVKPRNWQDIFTDNAEFRPAGPSRLEQSELLAQLYGTTAAATADLLFRMQPPLLRIVPCYNGGESRAGAPKVARYAARAENKDGELCDEVIEAIQTDDYLREWVTYGRKQHRSRRVRDAVRTTYCNPKICAKADLWLIKHGEVEMIDAKRRKTHHL